MAIVKKAGLSFLQLVSNSRRVSGYTLSFIGFICRLFPDARWKEFIRSAIQQVKWKNIAFGPRKTKVGSTTNIVLVPHLNELDFDAMMWNKMPYEEELYRLFDSRLSQYDVVIDIGANVGIFSLYAAKRNKEAKIFSFEPSCEAFSRLIKNINYNDVKNIVAYNAAVSDKTGFISFFEPAGHLTNGSLDYSFANIFDSNAKERIAITVAGDLLGIFLKHSRKILIKIDVEGAETYVLKSLEMLIEKHLPDIVIEVLEPYQSSLNELSFLSKYYDFFSIQDQGLVGESSFVAKSHWRDYFLQAKNRGIQHYLFSIGLVFTI